MEGDSLFLGLLLFTLVKGTKPLVPLTMGKIISLLPLYVDDFGIKYSTKADMPLNKEIKPVFPIFGLQTERFNIIIYV